MFCDAVPQPTLPPPGGGPITGSEEGAGVKISLIQMNTQENKSANLAQAERLIGAAVAEDRPDLVLLPEMFTMLSENLEAKRANAEVLPGPGTNASGTNAPGTNEPGEAYGLLQRLAAHHLVHVHG